MKHHHSLQTKHWEHFYEDFNEKYKHLSEENKKKICTHLINSTCKSSDPKDILGKLRHDFEEFFFDIDIHNIDLKKELSHLVMKIKIGLLLILFIVAIIYQIKNKDVPLTKTFANDPYYRKLFFEEIAFTFFFTFIAFSTIWWSRTGRVFSKQQMISCFGVAFIIVVYVCSQELSGYNRWISRRRILQGKGPYAEIDKKDPGHEYDFTGDPFVTSLGTFAYILVGIILFYYYLKVIYIVYLGYKSEKNNIKDISFILGKPTNTPLISFAGETVIFLLFTSIPFILAPYIRKDEFTNIRIISIVIMLIIYLFVQMSLQWTGSMPHKSHIS